MDAKLNRYTEREREKEKEREMETGRMRELGGGGEDSRSETYQL
jgi:hypothetical protein